MSEALQTKGIIIGEEERDEATRLLTVFTENFGKIKLHAIGARKITSKLSGRLSLFSLSEIYFVKGKRRNIVTDVYPKDIFQNIKQKPDLLPNAIRISNVLNDLVITDEKDEKIWTMTLWAFESVNEGRITNPYSLLLRLFELKMLEHLGYLPDFSKTNPYSFAPETIKALWVLSRDHKKINEISLNNRSLKELKYAIDLMINMIY